MVVIAAARVLASICNQAPSEAVDEELAEPNIPVEVVLFRVVQRLELLLGSLNFHALASHLDVLRGGITGR